MWPHWPGIAFKATAWFLHSLKSHLSYLNQYFKQIYWESNLVVTYQFWLPWLPPQTSIPTGYGPCPTSNINFKLNRPPDLTWPDWPTLTNQHWPTDNWPDLNNTDPLTSDTWHLTTDLRHGKEWYIQALRNSSPELWCLGIQNLHFCPVEGPAGDTFRQWPWTNNWPEWQDLEGLEIKEQCCLVLPKSGSVRFFEDFHEPGTGPMVWFRQMSEPWTGP